MKYKNQTEINNQLISEISKDIKFTAISVPNPLLIGIVNEHYITNKRH